MRIIAGLARSRPIKAPKGMDTRPTLDRVRETIFNILQFDVRDALVLDLYAGSGALALEAVSRGAAQAYLVDMSRVAADVIRENIASLHFEDKCKFLNMTDRQALQQLRGRVFDLIFLDPPYRVDATEIVLEMHNLNLIGENTILMVEYAEHAPRLDGLFTCYKHRDFGETHIGFYRLCQEG